VKIILHCYEYGGNRSKELNEYCEQVHYYKRDTGKKLLFVKKPYIVAGRNSEALYQRLLEDNYPILLEGLHTCALLERTQLKGRKIYVRAHNIEHFYYDGLAKAENNIFKRYYYLNESAKLKRFETVLNKALGIVPISTSEFNYFKKRYQNIHLVSAFHPMEKVEIGSDLGTYACYHGSLHVAENNLAALYLVNEVFKNTPHNLIIAGNHPSRELKDAVSASNNVKLVSDVSSDEIHSLVKDAQINILPTFQSTGLKLKLLLALFVGKHCLVNKEMVEHTGLENLCDIANSPKEFREKLDDLMGKEFSQTRIDERKKILENNFSNLKQGIELCKFIF
jgi:glycosyltransferase involved in cell wall biosynthesis